MVSEINETFFLIEDDASFEAKVDQWCGEPYLAIDTEFFRENTYYAKPGLIQIADRHEVTLVDPLKVNNLSALAPIMSDERIVKIMHSMSEDVELLHHTTGVLPSRVFDTQTAAAFLGYGASLGYQNLVAQVIGHELDKSETRSNWLQRPLTDSQLEYAAKDTIFLIQLYQNMAPRLEARDFLDSIFEESQFVIGQSRDSWDHPELAYLKLRGGWDLPLEKQALLKNLVVWRDELAKKRNVPKPWVLGDHALILVVQKKPRSVNDLKRIDSIKPKSIRLYGEALLAQLSSFQSDPDESFIQIEKPVKGDEVTLYKRLKDVVGRVSKESGIAPQLLGSRKMLERVIIHCVRHDIPELPVEFMGWRKKLVGERLIDALSR